MVKNKKILFVLMTIPFLIYQKNYSSSGTTDSSCSSESCKPCNKVSKNLWQPHAFSNYASQEILIMKGLDISKQTDEWLNRAGFATEFMQNFDATCSNSLGAMPFWSGTNTMTIGNNNGKADLDAYQFGMGTVDVDNATGIGGTITFSPKIQHVGSEFLWYGMQNNEKIGVYAKLKVPLGAMIIKSNVCEIPATETKTDLTSHGYKPVVLYYPNLTAALRGGTEQQYPVLPFGKLAGCTQTQIRFGDITPSIGINLVNRENALFGLGAKFSCPTGNVPHAVYMLEPIFGRAGHWGVGGELFGQYTFNVKDNDCEKNRSIRIWFQGEIMHLFNGRTGFRSFDFEENGLGSKYLMLQHYKVGHDTTGNLSVEGIVPAIEVTTLPVKSEFKIEGNFSLAIDLKHENWNLAIIGEAWGRSKENLSIHCFPGDYLDNNLVDYELSHYAVIGRQKMELVSPDELWCDPSATINQSSDYYPGTGTRPAGVKDARLPENRIPSDYSSALDICGAAANSIVTGKILGELGYTWHDNSHTPNLSLFGGAELSAKNNIWPKLWSVGLQGSIQF